MAKALELEVHKVTHKFPSDEKYRSVDQLRRSSAAVTNNIAEAYNKQSIKEKIHILRDISISKAEETESNTLRSSEKGFLSGKEAESISNKYVELKKATYGYIRFLRSN